MVTVNTISINEQNCVTMVTKTRVHSRWFPSKIHQTMIVSIENLNPMYAKWRGEQTNNLWPWNWQDWMVGTRLAVPQSLSVSLYFTVTLTAA